MWGRLLEEKSRLLKHLEVKYKEGVWERSLEEKSGVGAQKVVPLPARMQKFLLFCLRWFFGKSDAQVLIFSNQNARRRGEKSEKPFEALYQHRKNPYSATLFGELGYSPRGLAPPNPLWWLRHGLSERGRERE